MVVQNGGMNGPVVSYQVANLTLLYRDPVNFYREVDKGNYRAKS